MLSRFKVSWRIGAGMVFLMFMLMASNGQMLLGIGHVREQFGNVNEAAGQALMLQTVQKNFINANLLARQFRASSDPKYYEELLAKLDSNESILEKEEKRTPDEEDVIKFQSFRKKLQAYRSDAVKISELIQERNKIVFGQMDVLGPQISKSLDLIVSAAAQNADLQKTARFLPEDFLEVRLEAMKFLLNNKPENAEKVLALQKKVTEDFDAVQAIGVPGSVSKEAALLSNQIPEYFAAFTRVQAIITERNQIFDQKMSANIQDVTGDVSDMADEHINEQSDILKRESLRLNTLSTSSLIISGLSIALGIIASLLIARSITRPLRIAVDTVVQLSKGNTEVTIATDNHDNEISELLRACVKLSEAMNKSARLQTMLENLSLPIMVSDGDLNITYVNKASLDTLRKVERFLPVPVDKIVGSNIEIFYKNSPQQRGMLERLTESHRTSIQIGGESFNLTAFPILGAKRECLGIVVEWQDSAAPALVEGINRSQAVIEFQLDGTVLNANQNFLSVMGYNIEEIRGKHHSMFCEKEYVATPAYRQFWEALNRGEPQNGEFRCFTKSGQEIWIQALYYPVTDLHGRIFRVVKLANDITPFVQTRLENERGMAEAVQVLSAIAQGELSMKMQQDYKGAFAQIKESVNATVNRLAQTMKSITIASEAVRGAASEIAEGSQDLSSRTESQASSLEETAASMEEMMGTVKQNAQSAKDASSFSQETRSVAERGGQVVNSAISAMNAIEQSSQKIADIIGVIDEIAFQTNLLALNAAVEAARAGEAGKGFAVVASEVRALAGRSSSASKEIKMLIQESVAQVKSGSELVDRTGETLQEIISSVARVADIVSTIAHASQEQSIGIDQINTTVSQMDEMTQQNAALVEETAAASQSLAQKGEELQKLISYFRLSDEDAGSGRQEMSIPSSSVAQSSTKKQAASPKRSAVKSPKTNGKSAPMMAADAGWEEF